MTQQDIIKAAFKVWGRQFYLNTSLADLARELGVSKPALYRHFQNKESLIEAMFQYYFDDFTVFARDEFERAVNTADREKGVLIFVRTLAEYYLRNKDLFVFSFFQFYEKWNAEKIMEALRRRGMDMNFLGSFEYHSGEYPSVVQLIVSSMTWWVAWFHKNAAGNGEIPTEEAIQAQIFLLEEKIQEGLKFKREIIDKMAFEELEAPVFLYDFRHNEDLGGLFKAVVDSVAKAGPWNASMDMVAHRSGLSKSGLYAHFKSKQDMIKQLFMSVFKRLLLFAEDGSALSAVPEEQLYQVLLFVAHYLRTSPEILAAMNWLKTRWPNFGWPNMPPISRVFGKINIAAFEQEDREQISQWMIFLLISTLMRHPEHMSFADVPNTSIRIMYRFIALGLEGFNL
jgi:AcrR family transcriptional regulator